MTEDMRSLTFAICLLFCVIATVPALAQQDPSPQNEREERADAYYQEAVRMMNAGRYREAVEEFTAALELAPSPVLYCNRGIAFVKLSEWEDALSDLRRCRDEYETSEAEMAQIDAQYQGVRVMVRRIRPRAIQVSDGIARGDIEPQKVIVDEDEPFLDTETLGHLSFGTGAVFWTAALTLDFLSRDVREDFVSESQGGPGTSPERYRELRTELQNRKRVFIGLGIAGTALSLTGISLLSYEWFFKKSGEAQARSGQPTLFVAPRSEGAAMGLRLQF